MIGLQQITLQRGSKILLQDANLMIHAQQKVGIVGPNGAGKSSLFALLQGGLTQEGGDVVKPVHLRWAHIKQELPDTDLTALEYTLLGDEELSAVQRELQTAEETEDGIGIANAHNKLHMIDGYTATARAEKILKGLGFSREDIYKSVRALSGGWRMRLNLAQVLISRADVLLLDEPTNHLDFDTIVWIEDWLKYCPATVLIISHDREFLDQVATHIVHFNNQQLKIYKGNYSAFEKSYAEELRNQQAAFTKQQHARSHLQSFVDRFRAKASKAKQAQSRLRMLERMEVVAAVREKNPFHFQLKPAPEAGDPLLALQAVDFSYGNTQVLRNIQFALRPKERIGLIGKNGAGKSTLLKVINGELQPQSGEIVKNSKLKIGYFSQYQLDQLDDNASPILHLMRIANKLSEPEARRFLGSFNFQGNRVFDVVKHFSGGERARLALALLVWTQPNLLVLDEPTNHLDLEMREALVNALLEFNGAVIIVSHDRYLLNAVVDELWLIQNKKLTRYEGSLADYQEEVLHGSQAGDEVVAKKTTANATAAAPLAQAQGAAGGASPEKLQRKLTELEKKLALKQQKKSELLVILQDSNLYQANKKEELQRHVSEHDQVQKSIAELEEKIMEILGKLENLQ